MLKLTYTETSFHLEPLTQSLEEWVHERVILALRVGQRFSVKPSTVSFLLQADVPELQFLWAAVEVEKNSAIAIELCDVNYVEVRLRGSWLAVDDACVEGVLVAALSNRIEFSLFKAWQQDRTPNSYAGSGGRTGSREAR